MKYIRANIQYVYFDEKKFLFIVISFIILAEKNEEECIKSNVSAFLLHWLRQQ